MDDLQKARSEMVLTLRARNEWQFGEVTRIITEGMGAFSADMILLTVKIGEAMMAVFRAFWPFTATWQKIVPSRHLSRKEQNWERYKIRHGVRE